MVIYTEEKIRKLVRRLLKLDRCSLDTETFGAGQDWRRATARDSDALILDRARLLVASLADRRGSWCIPTDSISQKYLPARKVVRLIRPLLLSKKVMKLMHNRNYDENVFLNYGQKIVNGACTATMGMLYDENVPKSLKERCSFVGMILRKTKHVDFSKLDELAIYAEQDAVGTNRLGDAYLDGVYWVDGEEVEVAEMRLRGRNLMVYRFQEEPVLTSVIRAERRGIKINIPLLKEKEKVMLKDRRDSLKKIYRIAGKTINLNSTQQLGDVLFKKLKLKPVATTATGRPSLDALSLLKMRGQHEIVSELLKYRKIEKLWGTYAITDPEATSGLLYYCDDRGRIHCAMNTFGTVTGRFSCSLPNLQTIPARSDIYKLREVFCAPKGYTMIVADYSQIELRLMAIFSRDPVMCKVLRNPKGDIHQTTADEFKVARSPVAKFINFGLMYEMGPYQLQQILFAEGHDITMEQGKAYIDRYFQVYEGVPKFRRRLYEYHVAHGYIRMLSGKKRKVPNMDAQSMALRKSAQRVCINNLIQGSSQDIIKPAIVRADVFTPAWSMVKKMDQFRKEVRDHRKFLREQKLGFLLQIHDELIFYVKENKHTVEAAKRVQRLMEMQSYIPPIIDIHVPIRAEVGVAHNWLAAKKDENKVH